MLPEHEHLVILAVRPDRELRGTGNVLHGVRQFRLPADLERFEAAAARHQNFSPDGAPEQEITVTDGADLQMVVQRLVYLEIIALKRCVGEVLPTGRDFPK